jgi:hypothetical protein
MDYGFHLLDMTEFFRAAFSKYPLILLNTISFRLILACKRFEDFIP